MVLPEANGLYDKNTTQRANHLYPNDREETAERLKYQVFPLYTFENFASHAGGHWFESSSLHQKVPDFARNQELFFVFFR